MNATLNLGLTPDATGKYLVSESGVINGTLTVTGATEEVSVTFPTKPLWATEENVPSAVEEGGSPGVFALRLPAPPYPPMEGIYTVRAEEAADVPNVVGHTVHLVHSLSHTQLHVRRHAAPDLIVDREDWPLVHVGSVSHAGAGTPENRAFRIDYKVRMTGQGRVLVYGDHIFLDGQRETLPFAVVTEAKWDVQLMCRALGVHVPHRIRGTVLTGPAMELKAAIPPHYHHQTANPTHIVASF